MRRDVMKAAFGDDYGSRSELKRIVDLERVVEERELELIAAQRTITKLRMWSKMRTSAFQQKCLTAVNQAQARVEELELQKWEGAEAQQLYSR